MNVRETVERGPLLALDTATRMGSIAIGVDGRMLAELAIGVDVRHSEALLPALAFAFERTGLAADRLAGIVVGAGPGSFTGVRIAAATAKGLAFALDIPLFAFSSLEATAAGACQDSRPVCALFDARRDNVYGGCFAFGKSGVQETLVAPMAGTIDELFEATRLHAPLYTGDGALKHAERIERAGGSVACAAQSAYPRAASLLWLAVRDPERGLVPSPSRWQPDYVRAPGAQPMT